MIRALGFACGTLGAAAIAWAYLGGGHTATACAQLAIGSLLWLAALWLPARWWATSWASDIGLLAATAAAGLGLWLNLPAGWIIGGAFGGLIAWDLAALNRRLRAAAPGDDIRALAARHLAWLGLTVAAGVLLAAAALLLRLRLPFAWAAALALIAALGLGRLLAWLTRSGT